MLWKEGLSLSRLPTKEGELIVECSMPKDYPQTWYLILQSFGILRREQGVSRYEWRRRDCYGREDLLGTNGMHTCNFY